MSKKKGLGRGISALIPDSNEKEYNIIIELKITEIKKNPYQPRQFFNEDKLKELAQSITEHGIIQPLVVKKEKEEYILVAGERRLRAALLAGKDTVPVIVRDTGESEHLQIALIENLQRDDLNPLEEAMGYRLLIDKFSLTHEDVALKIGKSRSAVTNSLRLLTLAPEVQKKINNKELTPGQARPLLSIKDKEKQAAVADDIVKTKKSAREIEKDSTKWRNKEIPKKTIPEKKKDIKDEYKKDEYKEEEKMMEKVTEKMRLYFGTKVDATNRSNKGILEIEYYGNDDFERIARLILGNEFPVI